MLLISLALFEIIRPSKALFSKKEKPRQETRSFLFWGKGLLSGDSGSGNADSSNDGANARKDSAIAKFEVFAKINGHSIGLVFSDIATDRLSAEEHDASGQEAKEGNKGQRFEEARLCSRKLQNQQSGGKQNTNQEDDEHHEGTHVHVYIHISDA